MVSADELQRMARLVDMNRQRLDEIQNQIERIEAVQLEHDDARQALNALSSGGKGHIPLGAGVMIPTSQDTTTLVDLGSGVFGERSAKDAAELVSKRLEDLSELKSQFQKEAIQLQQRIEELASTFDRSAKEFSSKQDENTEVESAPKTESSSRKRRRSFGNELTLDD